MFETPFVLWDNVISASHAPQRHHMWLVWNATERPMQRNYWKKASIQDFVLAKLTFVDWEGLFRYCFIKVVFWSKTRKKWMSLKKCSGTVAAVALAFMALSAGSSSRSFSWAVDEVWHMVWSTTFSSSLIYIFISMLQNLVWGSLQTHTTFTMN